MLKSCQKIGEHIDDVTATQQARVESLLVRWDEIGVSSPLKITTTSQGTSGIIIDYEQERSNIRQAIGNCLGVYVPPMGFWEYTNRMMDFANGLSRLADRG
jgi:hypothetical protein